ncbi:MAG: histidine--tRNA ligase [Oscillospiraceae bacterium]|jgi:histidyl-tRNA synthetase
MELITQAPRGTEDILPGQSEKWQVVESVARNEAEKNGFSEIRTPVFEHTELFLRSVGETTDVVQKEMYTFKDKGNRSITLRPEGTAGAVRAFLEHGLLSAGMPQKFYYLTSCYRYEKAQKGRLREFHQFGIEMFGSNSPLSDAEVIGVGYSVLQRLGIAGISLAINSIGCPTCRAAYTKALKEYFSARKGELCETCLSRLERNPMRILDCKEKECQEIAANAPKILDFLCEDCQKHFDGVKHALEAMGISYTIDPSIVRGLDYYTNTVFEFLYKGMAICAGGRYNGLVEEMGGTPTPALGFGMGLERVILAMEEQKVEFPSKKRCDLFLASLGDAAREKSFLLAQKCKESGLYAEFDEIGRGLKAQMKYADKIGARFSLVLGDNEIESGRVMIKNMANGEKTEVSLGDEFLKEFCVLENS